MGYTFIDKNTGTIVNWEAFDIPLNEIEDFNKVVLKYSETTGNVPNTWELVRKCFKNGHLQPPTLEELESVPVITKEITNDDYLIWSLSKPLKKKETNFLEKVFNQIGESLFLISCTVIPLIVLLLFFLY